MKQLSSLLTLLILCSVIAYGYPLLSEGVTNGCSALEKKSIRVAAAQHGTGTANDPVGQILSTALMNTLQSTSNGNLAASAIVQKYPSLPPQIGCTLAYYQQ
jgi:hypothetical protein